jgi:hypothetical protein
VALVYPNGKALRELREKKVMSFFDVSRKAELAGTTTIRKMEHGLPCRVETMRKVLAALDVDMADAYRFMSYEKPKEV